METVFLKGIHGEKIRFSRSAEIQSTLEEIKKLYCQLPDFNIHKDTLVLDAYYSATIEGARTTVEQVKKNMLEPKTRDDKMVINTFRATGYALENTITEENIRKLWEMVVDGVCENIGQIGMKYRSGMVYVASASEVIHTPAKPEQIEELMEGLFAFMEEDGERDIMLKSILIHFYFVYVHPFCDGNGRTARLLQVYYLYRHGYPKMKDIMISQYISKRLRAYYGSLKRAEKVRLFEEERTLDVTPFLRYMLSVIKQALAQYTNLHTRLGKNQKLILERMGKQYNSSGRAELTVNKAAGILKTSADSAYVSMEGLVKKGLLEKKQANGKNIYIMK